VPGERICCGQPSKARSDNNDIGVHPMNPLRKRSSVKRAICERSTYPYNATLYSPPSRAVFSARDTLHDCAVAPRQRRRGHHQSYTSAGVRRLLTTSAAATPSGRGLFFPKRSCRCHRKKCANLDSPRTERHVGLAAPVARCLGHAFGFSLTACPAPSPGALGHLPGKSSGLSCPASASVPAREVGGRGK